MTLDSRFVETNGVRLHYLEVGEPDAKPLVFVHGNSHCGGVWAPLMRRLADQGFRCLGVDLRGHGHSDKAESGYDWGTLRDDIAGLVKATAFARPPLLVAHSRGGGVSLLAAAYNPGLARGVLAFEPTTPVSRAAPPGSNEPPPALRMAQRAERRRTAFPTRQFLFDYYRERDQFKRWTDEYLWSLIDYGTQPVEGGIERLCPGWIEAKLFEAMLEEGPWRGVTAPDVPVRLVYGEDSGRLAPGRDAGAPVRRIFPHMQQVVTAGATHFGPMERPDEFERLVLEFEASLPE